MKQIIRLLLVDDHPFFSEGLTNALRADASYQVVASVQSGEEVVAAGTPEALVKVGTHTGVALGPVLARA